MFKKQTEHNSLITSGFQLLRADESKQKDLYTINNLYLISDLAALEFQKSSDKSFKILSLFGVSMGLIFLLYAGILPLKLFLVAYIIIFISGIVYFIHTSKGKTFSMHLTARNIAELLRVRFFSRLSGIDSETDLDFSRMLREYNF